MNIRNVINPNINRNFIGGILVNDPDFFHKAKRYNTARITGNHPDAGEYAIVRLLQWDPATLSFFVENIQKEVFWIGLENLSDFVL